MTAAPVSSQELSTARIVRLCGAAALEVMPGFYDRPPRAAHRVRVGADWR